MILCCLSSPVLGPDARGYPQKRHTIGTVSYRVPSMFPDIQSAVDAAAAAGGNNVTILVEEGEYREHVVVKGLRNVKLIGHEARIQNHFINANHDGIHPDLVVRVK